MKLELSEEDLEILEDLTKDACFYERKVINPLHRKILNALEKLRKKESG